MFQFKFHLNQFKRQRNRHFEVFVKHSATTARLSRVAGRYSQLESFASLSTSVLDASELILLKSERPKSRTTLSAVGHKLRWSALPVRELIKNRD